ncbi:hypothetical protein J7E49_21410 [Variovorax paradoxus]|nr:hypothetical protein [Variovorax paradoxus]
MINMKSIAILVLALAGNAVAGDVAYKCVGAASGSTSNRSQAEKRRAKGRR